VRRKVKLMVLLSEFLRFSVAAPNGQRGRLADLAIDLGTGDYPQITYLLLHAGAMQHALLAWDAVQTIDWPARQIRVADLHAALAAPQDSLVPLMLLKRDLLDSMVLDLADQIATVANDLWLEEADHHLAVRAADISPWAVVRRLSHGWLGHGSGRHALDWKDVEFLRGNPAAARAGQAYQRRITRIQAAEIAQLVEALPYLHATELLILLPHPLAADVLEALSAERQLQVFEELDADESVRLLALMAPDAAADLVARLPPDLAQRALEGLPERQSARIIDLLRYPADTAGGIMTNDLVVAPMALTVAEARHVLHDQLAEPDFIYYIYVVDALDARQLRGVVTVRDLLLADDTRSLEEIMRSDMVTIDPLEPAKTAARRVADNALAALPVVGPDGRLLGAVTADTAVAQLAPRAWREQAPRVFS
jgi:magnesium transporter